MQHDDHDDHTGHDHDDHTGHDGHGQHGHDHGAGAAPHAGHAGGHAAHADVFRRKFWVSLVLTVPAVVYSHMAQDLLGYTAPMIPGHEWVAPLFGTTVFLYGGPVFLVGGWGELRRRQPGMMLLISLGLLVAFGASVATELGWMDVDLWFELATLVTIMLLGHWQEMKAVGQAQGALGALAELLPDEAERLTEDGVEAVPVSALVVGDRVLVRPGGRVPGDGTIVDGGGSLDESMITGESRPVRRGRGDRVVAGTVVTDASLRVEITAAGDDTALAGIQRLVADAQASRSRAQVLADRFAALLFYVAVASGTVTFLVWWALGDVDQAVERAVTVLVIACPHALGLAIPLVVALSTALAARNGILVKDRLALERVRTVDTVLFDKTGTLTRGTPVVTDVAGDGRDVDEVLALAAAVEADSEHPLAKAIVAHAATVDGSRRTIAHGFITHAGRGVRAFVGDRVVQVGGPAMLREHELRVPPGLRAVVDGWRGRGATVLFVVDDDRRDPHGGHVVGALALEDEVRPESRAAVAELRDEGIDSVMLTGDAETVARAVADRIGIEQVVAEVLPEDKDRAVLGLQADGRVVAMVGDGVNDAPALARADVGLAIGAGTDVAIESAGIVLASSDPRSVAGVVRLSRAVYRKMLQNLAWGAGYNLVAIPLAAGVFAFAGVTLSPAIGAVLMSASTIVVALNAQLLRKVQLRPAEAGPDRPDHRGGPSTIDLRTTHGAPGAGGTDRAVNPSTTR